MGRTNLPPGVSSLCMLVLLALALLQSAPTRAERSLSVEEEELEEQLNQPQLSTTHPSKKLQWLKDNYKTIVVGIANVLNVPILTPAIRTAMDLIPKADKMDIMHFELDAINARLDIFYEELKWASGDFQLAVGNIANAWLKYSQMGQNNKVLESIFAPFYSQFVDSALVLHKLLIAEPESNMQSLGDVLAKKLRCHEKDIEAQFLYLNKLVCRGNVMDEKYYELKGVNSDERKKISSKIASESALALSKSHRRCITNIELYIKRDIIERIDAGRVHQEIANTIGRFLQKTYDRYEWLVVAFTTHNSKKTATDLKSHVLMGFGKIQRGSVTVAVAGQVKGSHNQINVVKNTIEKCIGTTPECSSIDKKISECEEKVLNRNLSQIITAIHVFSSKSQSFTPSQHVYTGKCGGSQQFHILIKSDEVIALKNPCDKLKCENGGKCEVVPLTVIPMCECPYPFYGQRCEENLKTCVATGTTATNTRSVSKNRGGK